MNRSILFVLPIDMNGLAEFLGLDCDPPIGSGSTFMFTIIQRFLQNGDHVIVATVSDSCQKEFYFVNNKLSLYVGPRRNNARLRALDMFKSEISHLKEFIAQQNYDISFALWSYEFALASLAVDKEKTVVVMHDWPKTIFDIYHDYYRFMRLMMAKRVFRTAKKYICVSPYIEEQLKEMIHDTESYIIPNAVTVPNTNGNKSINSISPRIISVNNSFFGLKNVDKAVEAFSIILREKPGAELHLFGKENGKDGAANEWIIRNHYEKNVFLHGPVEHEIILDEISKSDILLSTSKEESFGLTLVEGELSRILVVAGKNTGAAPWILDNGRCGILIDVNDPVQISNNILSILKTGEQLNRLIECGYNYAVENFEVEAIWNKWNIVCNDYISERTEEK